MPRTDLLQTLPLLLALTACGDDPKPTADTSDATSADVGDTTSADTTAPSDADATAPNGLWGAPLDPESPWPKFRRDLAQTGRSPVLPTPDLAVAPWTYKTGKGVFSTPVIGADGTVYVGSADRHFYAIDAHGALRWSFETGEIIDSSALLDDAGRVIFGSGDGHVYTLDRQDGHELWRFEAEDPATLGSFIRWFEGNIAILPNGDLVAPNDNFCTYALDRASGAKRWCHQWSDQTWSLPAVDRATGTLYGGNNFYFGMNVAALDPAAGAASWTSSTQGSVAASPLLLDDRVVVGAFDGWVRAFARADGGELWATPLPDHVYASPALAADGAIIQPGADGAVWALDASDGHVLWSRDLGTPIRSSPAIDGAGHIYVGGGDGRLAVLDPDGAVRWTMKLVTEDRNDLNASPALGEDGVVIAAESGEVFFVPWDYCLRGDAAADARCERPPFGVPADGAWLYPTTRFGTVTQELAASIEPREPLVLSLVQRAGGVSTLAVIDEATLAATTSSGAEVSVVVSGDRRFAVIVPEEPWADRDGGTITVHVTGQTLVAPFERTGLRIAGGAPGAALDETLTLTVAARGVPPSIALPAAAGSPGSVWELSRLAAPLPTILPSYNQIGFDSIHYLVGLVPTQVAGRAVAWAIGARPTEDGTVVDPTSRVRFPLVATIDGATVTFENRVGFGIDFNGFTLPFARFFATGVLGPSGSARRPLAVFAEAVCKDIDFYGDFLRQLGFCSPEGDLLVAAGAFELGLKKLSENAATGVGTTTFELAASTNAGATIVVHVAGSAIVVADHAIGVLPLDEDGLPLACDYVGTTTTADADGHLASTSITCARPPVETWLMVDTHAVAGGVPEP